MADTWSDILAASRLMARDTSTTNPGVADAQALILFNRRARAYYNKFEPRLVKHASSLCGLVAGGTTYTMTTTPTNYSRIHSIHRQDANTDTDGPSLTILEDMPGRSALGQLISFRENEGAEPGTPTHAAIYRGSTSTPSSVGKWKVDIAPLPDGLSTFYFSVLAEVAFTDVTSGADAPDISLNGASFLTCILAHDMARLLNRPMDFRQALLDEAGSFADVAAFLGKALEASVPRPMAGRLG